MPKISELPLAATLTGDETLPVVQDGELKQADVIGFVQGAAAAAIEDAVQQVGEGVMTSGAFIMNSARLLGRTSPDVGRVEEITLGAGLALVDGVLSAEGDSAAAPLESPAFTGNPTAPTPTPGDNDTSIATTAFVQAAIAALIAGAPGGLDTLTELAAALGNDANFAATITNALALRAPLASPGFTGNPTAPTPAPGDNDTSIATTAFVQAAIAALVAGAPGALDSLTELAAALGNDANFAATITNALALRAPLASPGFTGNPTAPTPATGDNDTSIATTAFVQAELMPTVNNVGAGSTATATPNISLAGDDVFTINEQAASLTIAAPTGGTPAECRPLIFRIKDNGISRSISWNAIYRPVGVTLPTATVAGKTLYVGFLYNAYLISWDCVLVRQQA